MAKRSSKTSVPVKVSDSSKATGSASEQKPGRIESLDAFRGFNMFWIMGGADTLEAIAEKLKIGWFSYLSDNMTKHVEWEGIHYHDMIFPIFLFIMGVVTPYSLGRRQQEGASRASLQWAIIRRTLLLFLLGLFYYGVLDFKGIEHQRVMGVLQRLALGWGFAATIALYTGNRARVIWTASLLVGYFLIMRFMPVPGFHTGDFSQWGNYANYVDRVLFVPGQYYEKYGDPEGLFSTIPAIGTCLLGVMAGAWLKSGGKGMLAVRNLAIAGVACILAGYAWSPWFPVIKKIWTSSYVLVAGGWSLLLLSLFYFLVDVKAWGRHLTFFSIIGRNPITIYVAQRLIDFDHTAERFVKGLAKVMPEYADIIKESTSLAIKWLFLRFLDRHKVYPKC